MRNRKWIGLLTAVVVAAACLGLTACGDTAVTGVKLDKTTASVEVGKTVTLKATVEPEDASDKSVTWTTDKAAVATVKDGVVTGVAAGTAKNYRGLRGKECVLHRDGDGSRARGNIRRGLRRRQQ